MKSEKLNELLFTWRDLMIFFCVFCCLQKKSIIKNIFKADVLEEKKTYNRIDT